MVAKPNPELLKKFDLTPAELYLLLTIMFSIDTTQINSLIDSLLKKGYLEKFDGSLFSNVNITSEKGKSTVTSFLYEEKTNKKSEDLTELANTLKELFPKGTKSEGHPWRSNTKEVVEKLKKFKMIYPYSNDQIIEATQRYVSDMENLTYMRTLKHFIIKRINGENVSDLASYIENDTTKSSSIINVDMKYNGQ